MRSSIWSEWGMKSIRVGVSVSVSVCVCGSVSGGVNSSVVQYLMIGNCR